MLNSGAWPFRAFEERTYSGVAHNPAVVALLVAPMQPDEVANGVATAKNPNDRTMTNVDAYHADVPDG